MVRIGITPAAFEAIDDTLPLGSVGFERDPDAKGELQIWLDAAVVDPLAAIRRPGESFLPDPAAFPKRLATDADGFDSPMRRGFPLRRRRPARRSHASAIRRSLRGAWRRSLRPPKYCTTLAARSLEVGWNEARSRFLSL